MASMAMWQKRAEMRNVKKENYSYDIYRYRYCIHLLIDVIYIYIYVLDPDYVTTFFFR